MISDKVRQQIQFVATQVCPETTDWLVAKKEMLKTFAPCDRKGFSTRHPKSKKHVLNPWEREVIQLWHDITGNTLVLAPDKTQGPEESAG